MTIDDETTMGTLNNQQYQREGSDDVCCGGGGAGQPEVGQGKGAIAA
jgi:hypothetical protein